MRFILRFPITLLFIGILILVGCEATGKESSNSTQVQPEKPTVVKGPDQPKQPVVLPPQPQSPNPTLQQQPNGEEKQPELSEEELYRHELEALQKQKAIYSGPKHSKKIALTFDDGPDQNFTIQVLDILKREKVPATFFVVGRMVNAYPEVLKRIDQEGHVIGNHTYSHPELPKLSQEKAIKQIEMTNQIIQQTIGKNPTLFRPPYGAFTKSLTNQVAKRNMKVVYWNVDTLDWNHRTTEQVVATVKSKTQGGAIILQHSAGNDGLQASVNALPKIIAHYKSLGYEFVTIDKLLETSAYH